MEPIKITEEHKSKLLEMCNKLFHEGCMNKHDFDDNDMLYIAKHKTTLYKKTVLHIHWFEFCIFYLIDKIFNEDQEESYLSNKDFYKGGLSFGDEHPIDILYKEFQKRQPKEQYLTEHIAHIMGIKTREK